MKSVEIMIPNRFSWDSICLTVESILKRTDYPDFRITVCDNSLAENRFACEPHKRETLNGDDGNRRDYLRRLAIDDKIKLIENHDQDKLYGHGENIKRMLDGCTADFAFLFNSTSEVIRPDWISVLVDKITEPKKYLGVARLRSGGNHFDKCWITPTYWPNMMLLNMPLYRDFYPDNDWKLEQVAWHCFPRFHELFDGEPPPRNPDWDPVLVFCDTGWTLYEKVWWHNPRALRMLKLPDNYWNKYIKWRGGIDRNSHNPNIPHVQQVLGEVKVALNRLRNG